MKLFVPRPSLGTRETEGIIVFQIEINQFKSLFRLFLRLDFSRGRSGKSKSRFVRMLILYGVLGGTLSGALAGQSSPVMYVLIGLSYLMLMTASAVLLELGQELMLPEEFETLGFFPISSRTYFAAKIGHLLFYTGLISGALALFPALLGWTLPGSDGRFPLAFVLGGLAAGVFSAAVMGLLVAFLIRLMETERLRYWISLFQISLTFGLVMLFQFIPRGSDSAAWLHDPALSSWKAVLPPAWFAGLVLKLSGQESAMPWLQIGAALSVSAGILLAGLRRMGRFYLTWVAASATGTEKPVARRRTRTDGAWMPRFLVRHPEIRAGYGLTVQMLRRDRSVQLSVFPIIGLALAFLLRAVLEPRFVDPFVHLSGFDSDMSSNLFFYFLFAGIPIILNQLTTSRDFQAAWVYLSAPVRRPYRLIQGMRFAVLLIVLIPFFILMSAIFAFRISAAHAVRHALFLFLAGLTLYSLLGVGMRHLPFSRERQQISRVGRFLSLLLAVPVFVAVRFLQRISYPEPGVYWSIVGIFAGILIILEAWVYRRFHRNAFLKHIA